MPRSNDAAARMLQEFAELLAISGGDPFKVRAYEKAARMVEGYGADIAGLDEKALDAIPSVGAHLARKIAEFQRTGSVEELEDLRAQVPAGVRSLLEVPGLGPKRAHQVYEELGVTSVGELLDALHEHRLQHLDGWGARSEENLAKSVRDAHLGGDRIQLAVGLGLAEEILASLSALPGGNEMRITAKASGEHSSALAGLRPGTAVAIEGPYGAFTRHARRSDRVLLVADAYNLRRLVPDIAARDLYVCGPGGFMKQLIGQARALGVPDGRIHHEDFAF